MSDGPLDDRLRVRPYAPTGGRVRSSTELALESIVRLTDRGATTAPSMAAERRRICELCATPSSIVEIAALLTLPLGVVRVLVGDLVTEGVLACNSTPATAGDRPDRRLLERVLDGLQAL